jgi:proline iminopeptidase
MRSLVFAASLILVAASTALSQTDNKPAEAKRSVEAAAPTDEGYFVGADGVRLFYRKLGSGKDVAVFLHGGPGGGMYDGGCDMGPLAKGRTIILYDQRGGGRSEIVTDPKSLTAAHHVRDLEALRRHFRLERMTLIGLSWGSGLAALYTADHPQRVKRLLLISPMPLAQKPYAEEREKTMVALLGEGALARRREIFLRMPTAGDAEARALCRELRTVPLPYRHVARSDRDSARSATGTLQGCDRCESPPAALRNQSVVNRATIRSLGEGDFRPLLARFRVPALVVEGEKTTVPLSSTRGWAEAIPNARLLLIPEAGHLVFVDQPEAFFKAAETFLRGKFPKEAEVVRKSTSR